MLSNGKFAAALNEQSRFAGGAIGDFILVPEIGRHVWKGKIATTTAELAEQVNGAVKEIAVFRDPFKTLEVVSVGIPTEMASEEDKDSIIAALKTANAELRTALLTRGPRKLQVAQ
jgi:hypothetical protein